MSNGKRNREEKTVMVTPPEVQTASTLRKEPYLIFITGDQSGKTVPIPKTGVVTIGRSPQCDLVIQSNECSRQHSRLYVGPEGAVYAEDLGSTNGTYVNGKKIEAPAELKDGDRINIGNAAILKFSFQDAIEERFQSNLYESATRDPLTNIFNKKYFLENLDREFRLSQRHDTPLSLLMFDLDFFKQVNDNYGHLFGDEVLKTVTRVVTNTIRKETIFARYGGEEFAIILNNTSKEQAGQMAERVRECVQQTAFDFRGKAVQVTISVGVAFLEKDYATSIQLIEYADQALYEAKRTGRNKVCRYVPERAPSETG